MKTLTCLNGQWQKCGIPSFLWLGLPSPHPLFTKQFSHVTFIFCHYFSPPLLTGAHIVEQVSMTTVAGWSHCQWQGRSPKTLTFIPPLFDFQYFLTNDQLPFYTKANVGSAPMLWWFKQRFSFSPMKWKRKTTRERDRQRALNLQVCPQISLVWWWHDF